MGSHQERSRFPGLAQVPGQEHPQDSVGLDVLCSMDVEVKAGGAEPLVLREQVDEGGRLRSVLREPDTPDMHLVPVQRWSRGGAGGGHRVFAGGDGLAAHLESRRLRLPLLARQARHPKQETPNAPAD